MHILFFIIITILLVVIYILSSREENKTNVKYEHKGKLEEYWVEKERRKCQRLDAVLDIKYKLLKSTVTHSRTRSKNISEVGMCILTYEMLPIGSPIEIKIALSESKELIEVKGNVAWCQESEKKEQDGRRSFLTGVKFAEIDKKHKDGLLAYMNAYCPTQK